MPRAPIAGNAATRALLGAGAGNGASPGIAHGDRCLFLGPGQLGGKQCDVLSIRRVFACARFDSGVAVLTLAAHLHPVPRRPPPMW